jgi:TolA-binding protein/predicted negative regulator of RcsB-dependent stress response
MATRTTIGLVLVMAALAMSPRLRAQEAPVDAGKEQSVPSDITPARKLFDDGRWEEALKAFRAIREQMFISKQAGTCLYYEGWCLFNLGQYADAATTFGQLADAYPGFSSLAEAILKKGECYLALEDYEKALTVYREFRKQFAQHPLVLRADLGEAWVYHRQGKPSEVAQLLRPLTQQTRDPDTRLDALYALGQNLLDQKQHRDARQVFDELVKDQNNPRAAEVLFSAADAMFAAGQFEAASSYYKRIVPRAGLLAEIDAQLAQMKAYLANPSYRDRFAAINSQIQHLLQRRKKWESSEDLRPRCLIRIANCYQEMKKWDEACVIFSHFLRVYQKGSLPASQQDLIAQAEFGYGQTLTSRGQANAGLAQFERFKKMFPDHPLARGATLSIANSALAEGRYSDALALFRNVRSSTKVPEEGAKARFQMGECHIGLKQWTAALQEFQTFVAEYPSSEMIPGALFELGRIEIELAGQALQQNDRNAYFAHLTASANHYDIIVKQYTREAPSLLADVYFQLGYLNSWLSEQDHNRGKLAATAFRAFLADAGKDPRATEAKYQLARSLANLGEWDASGKAYREVIDQSPDSEWGQLAAWEIASSFAAMSQADKMLDAIRHYAKTYPMGDHIGDALWIIGTNLESDAQSLLKQNKTTDALAKQDEALTIYRQLVDLALTNPRESKTTNTLLQPSLAAVLRISSILKGRNQIDAARNTCEVFLKSFMASPTVMPAMITEITRLMIDSNQAIHGSEFFESLAKAYPEDQTLRVRILIASTELALSARDPSRALESAEALLAIKDEQILTPHDLCIAAAALLENQRYDQALDVLKRAKSLAPPENAATNCLIDLRIGLAHLGLREYDKALDLLSHVVSTCGEDQDMREQADFGIAQVREKTGDTDAAARLYRKLIGGRSKVAAYAAYRAAEMHFGIAQSLAGTEAEPQANQRTEQYTLARAYYLRSAALTTGIEFETATFRAAQCLEGIQSRAAACDGYKLYADRFPHGQFIAEAHDKIETLCKRPK